MLGPYFRVLAKPPSSYQSIGNQIKVAAAPYLLRHFRIRPPLLQSAPAGKAMDAGIEDPEKKKKKEEKAREKELKKQKALEKAAKFQAQQANAASKKSEKKSVKRGNEEDENAADFVDPLTPVGQKKQMSKQMAKQYSPSAVEKAWYEWWEEVGFFVPDAKSSKPPFVIVFPPPNVTGALHIGHALTAAIEDTMIRWRRMSGYNALWVPGMDHAGIATQVVVEKKLMRERNLTRHDIGRDEFVSEVWKWKNNYGGTILKQLRRLGASLDWSRECFTMDEKRSNAVTEAFVRLHKQGLIYRDNRLVNWDCVLRTAISEIEVDYIDIKERTSLEVPGYKNRVEFGVLTSFAYPLEDNLGEIVVATTRVETMLGDTAIAVHPDDDRYKHLHGKHAIHPFNGRRIRIICDAILVDPEFGTGAVKITPAHDPNDFNVGKRHNLDFINVFTDDGKINQDGGEFAGMPRFKAREEVTEALKKKGLFKEATTNEMRLGICSRSKDVVEPMIKPQWYVKCSGMAKGALDAAVDDDNRKLDIIPRQYNADWKRWLENIRDWCVSRQLWWGHRIPAWYAVLDGDKPEDFGSLDDRWVVARNEEEAKALASQRYEGKEVKLEQDPDVLDTWFSSGLFPLSVLGWPEDTEDLRAFYPTSVLETGHDIIFFWVSRMVMLGSTLGGNVPFTKVYLHPMIRDAHGRKMSKSLGNVIDPLDVINGVSLEDLHKKLSEGNLDLREIAIAKEGQKKDFPDGIAECGSDALHFALVSYTAQSDKINLDIQRVVGYRQWCNKLWNAVRFAMSKLGDDYVPLSTVIPDVLPFSCRWILSVLNKAISKTILSLDSYEFSDAATAVYAWWQYQLCDVFIEAIKPYFAGNNPKFASERGFAQDTLWLCLDTGLRLLHPFMPFVTEELWQRLPSSKHHNRAASIMICDYPSIVECWTNERVESEMSLIDSIVRSLRSLSQESRERRPAFVLCRSMSDREILCRQQLEIETLANLSSLTVISENEAAPTGCAVSVVNENLSVYLKVLGSRSAEIDLEKIRKKMEDIKLQQEKITKVMNAAGYKEKVPEKIQKANADKLESLEKEKLSLEEASQHMEAQISSNKQD
ncbi:putative valine--tRNA ligase [Rosa chinensis]|uniref:Valine--tRNA ligase, mitochondrial n=1 Tax=Rosa chinensis TaxID=74649 RepID=A0A2P6SMY3_ROSCH|nr:valine--tRNA ligase, mitochondrial 1 [Rosa chinensis]PRQ60023.1 putative valine--tRNA ligase [Rosa chinensis]